MIKDSGTIEEQGRLMMRVANIESIKSSEEREREKRLDQGASSSSRKNATSAPVRMETENVDDTEMTVNELMSLTGAIEDARDMLNWSSNVADAVRRGNWEDDVRKMNKILAEEGKVILHEVYSPPRVNQMAERPG